MLKVARSTSSTKHSANKPFGLLAALASELIVLQPRSGYSYVKHLLARRLTAVPALGQWCQSLWGRFLWGLSLGALHAGCAPRELCAAPLAASRAADAVP